MVKEWPFLKLSFFIPKLKSTVSKIFVIYFIGFDPIKIQPCQALNLSFVKDINAVCEKMTRNGNFMAKIIVESDFLRTRLYSEKKMYLIQMFWF